MNRLTVLLVVLALVMPAAAETEVSPSTAQTVASVAAWLGIPAVCTVSSPP